MLPRKLLFFRLHHPCGPPTLARTTARPGNCSPYRIHGVNRRVCSSPRLRSLYADQDGVASPRRYPPPRSTLVQGAANDPGTLFVPEHHPGRFIHRRAREEARAVQSVRGLRGFAERPDSRNRCQGDHSRGRPRRPLHHV